MIELQLRWAREKSLLGFHTNQKLVWKFTVGSDKARGIYYTHLSLENSLEPASSKTSITIAGVYDTEDSLSRRSEILRGVYEQVTKLNFKHRVQIDFPKLTNERVKELKSQFIAKGSDFIDKQLSAKKQLELKNIPASHISFKFNGPVLFKVTKEQVFQPLSAKVFKQKIGRSEVIQPVNQGELFHQEVQDLSKLHPETELTPCPLCCRAFRSKLSTCKHVILCHENYKVNKPKENFHSFLKSAINVRVTSLSKLC